MMKTLIAVFVFTISVTNMFSQENKKSGIGIVNCRKRLDLLYPDRYELTTIEEAGGIYRVFLKIQLQ